MSSVFKRIGIIIQARMGSTRLPSKIMLHVNDQAIFQIQIDRLRKISYPLYIATTVEPADAAIAEFSKKNNIPYYRGDENNVLSRYYECAKQFELDLIIRLTSDCPLIDAELIKQGIEQYVNEGDETLYLSNTIERTYPRGFDFEIFSFQLLEDAYRNALDPADKEHVTPYIWKNKSGKVRFEQIKRETDESKYRLTLDTPEDFELLNRLIEKHHADRLTGEEIIGVMQSNPELALINQHIEQKKS
jgi:spore coat polysaccharide biosynthesis protein SpsF